MYIYYKCCWCQEFTRTNYRNTYIPVHTYNNRNECDIDEISLQMLQKDSIDWHQEVLNKPKLRTYVTFKSELHVEDYLYYVTNRRSRSLLGQFRMGILPLYVETGRFNNTPLERRLCTCCSLNEIEDEYHFLMICPKYDNLRHNLFSKITDINLNVLSERDKFAKILKFYQKYLANYIVEAFEIRQKLVFNSNNW